MPTTNMSQQVLKKHKVLQLVRAKEFLQNITASAGLVEPLEDDSFAVFYTMTRCDGQEQKRVLYITLFDHKERRTHIVTEGQNGSLEVSSGKAIEIDTDYDIVLTTLPDPSAPMKDKQDPIASDTKVYGGSHQALSINSIEVAATRVPRFE